MSDKTIETLIPDIQGLFEGHSLSEALGAFTTKLGDTLTSRFEEHLNERTPTLRMSNIGRPLRQLWYELKGYPKEKLSSETKFKFLYGDLLEALVLFLASEAGHEVTDLQKKVEINGVTGSIDAIIDGVLVDVKSCSTYSFDKFKSGRLVEDDPFGYIAQLSGYRTALGIDRAAFVAVDKVLGKLCLLELTGTNVLDVGARIQNVRDALASDIEPEKCYDPKPVSSTDKSGNLVLSVGCSYCGFKEHCWRDANDGQGLLTYYYSTGPKYFVKVEKEPRVSRKPVDNTELPFPVKEQETKE